MKKFLFLVLAILAFSQSTTVRAESAITFSIYGQTSNLWSDAIFQIPPRFLNAIFTGVPSAHVGYDFMTIKQNGNKVKMDGGSFWGFKAKDLFGNIRYGLKVGWCPELSPVGIYVSCAYQYRQFKADFQSIQGWQKYKLHSVRPSVGVTVTPFLGLLEDNKIGPMLEVSTGYNCYFSAKAPFSNSLKQFKSGIVSSFGIGIRDKDFMFTGGIELNNNNLFNTDFSPSYNDSHPYENVTTKHIGIYLNWSRIF